MVRPQADDAQTAEIIIKNFKSRWFKFAAMLAGLVIIGMALGFGYERRHGLIIPAQFFVTAANNVSPSERDASVASQPGYPADDIVEPAPNTKAGTPSIASPSQSSKLGSQSSGNALVLNRAEPLAPAAAAASGGALTVPKPQSSVQSAGRLPVIGSEGQTIWVPQAIEGCWAGSGDGSLHYLGGCRNLFSGSTSPVRLRWCFRRIGDQPLTLITAKGQYTGRVSQRWDVTGARGEIIDLRETISYKTKAFLRVVDVGYWSCRITPMDELARQHAAAQPNGRKLRGSAAVAG